MDLAQLRLLRRPSRPIREATKIADVNGAFVSTILARKQACLKSGVAFDRQFIETWKTNANNPDPIEWSAEGQVCDAQAKYLYAVLGRMDRSLAARNDRPLLDDFLAQRDSVLREIVDRVLGGILSSASLGIKLAFLLIRLFWVARLAQAVLWGNRYAGLIVRLLTKSQMTSSSKQITVGLLKTCRTNICDWIAAEMATSRDGERLRLLTRLLLVLDTLNPELLPKKNHDRNHDNYLWDRLHRRTAVLPPAYLAFCEPKVELLRTATVSDHFVVRNEWKCYVPGEIANIINVLAGESFEQKTVRTDEEESTTHHEQDQLLSSEQSQEDKSTTELSREIEKATSLQVNAQGSVDVSGSYGVTTFGASAQVGVSSSQSESSRQANKMSQEMVKKSIARVDSRMREERIRRTLTKVEHLTQHAINNKSGKNRAGIYRWLDRIDTYQVFRYADRFLLEVQIPEPATYFRWRLDNPTKKNDAAVSQPPEFSVTPREITEKAYGNLALTYHASNLPPPPDAIIIRTAAMADTNSKIPSNDPKVPDYAAPQLNKTIDITIDSGYEAVALHYSGTASPSRGYWGVENSNMDFLKAANPIQGFHYIRVEITSGGKSVAYNSPGQISGIGPFAVQLAGDDETIGFDACIRSHLEYGHAFLPIDSDSVSLLPKTGNIKYDPPVRQSLAVGIAAVGAAALDLSFKVECRRTAESFHQWQDTVYDLLLSAWKSWDQEWRDQELQKAASGLVGINATSPARNKEIIVEELKRQTIAWLLNNANYGGVDAMGPAAPDVTKDWQRYDIAKARAIAPLIQFMEQAFEWGNLTYTLYPFFWSRKEKWPELADYSGADPNIVAFARSGSARVVVPARPGFEFALLHWLLYQEPFMGEPLPVPGDPLYVSVAEEMQSLTDVAGEGEPGYSWQAKMATTLVWLDSSSDVPVNTQTRLGKPPNEPKDGGAK